MIKGIGIDAVAISRMDKKRISDYIVQRMFHPREAAQALGMTEERPFFLASRFAAKEAFVKALGTGFTAIAPRNIEVVVDQKGQPSITLSEEDRQRLGLGEVNIHLSLAHEEPLALAFVVLELLHGQR